jgi:hypothetical protein
MKRQLDQDREDHEAAQLRAGNLLKEMQQEALTAQRLQEEQHKYVIRSPCTCLLVLVLFVFSIAWCNVNKFN